MDEELKEKWLEALRSGRYRQARGSLKGQVWKDKIPNVGYCCLGVLCDVSALGDWNLGDFVIDHNGEVYRIDIDFPEEFLDVFGLTPSQQTTLIEMNDGAEFTFEQIAEYIESEL